MYTSPQSPAPSDCWGLRSLSNTSDELGSYQNGKSQAWSEPAREEELCWAGSWRISETGADWVWTDIIVRYQPAPAPHCWPGHTNWAAGNLSTSKFAGNLWIFTVLPQWPRWNLRTKLLLSNWHGERGYFSSGQLKKSKNSVEMF